MKLKEIYDLAVNLGVKADPRGQSALKKILKKAKDDYKKLSKKEKTFFDKERFTNPYADTRILVGELEAEVKTVLAGIDMEVGEVLLADRLRERGKAIDLILSHHPEGKALAALHEVMKLQADVWHQFGVPINVGDALIGERAKEVFRAFLPLNHNRAVDVAKLLGMSLMCVHTPADNLVTEFLQKNIEKKKPETVGDVVDLLSDIPEYSEATKLNTAPTIIAGDSSRRAGKVMVDMTGGTEGPEDAVKKLSEAGVGTLVGMHMSEKLRKIADESKLNVVIAGHIASDSLGLNLFLDKIEVKGVKIIPCSGFIRVKRS